MSMRFGPAAILATVVVSFGLAWVVSDEVKGQKKQGQAGRPRDAVEDFQKPQAAASDRPEQQKSKHDRSNVFDAPQSPPINPALNDQPKKGDILGFDFYRDPLNADRPMMTFQEVMKQDLAEKPKVMQMQRQLLAKRYNLEPKFDAEVKMSRGKPLCVGPTARLANGLTWEALADMAPEDVRKK